MTRLIHYPITGVYFKKKYFKLFPHIVIINVFSMWFLLLLSVNQFHCTHACVLLTPILNIIQLHKNAHIYRLYN